ncbi:MAG: tetratricopeptide repeat protein [Pseudomonadota bacterium]
MFFILFTLPAADAATTGAALKHQQAIQLARDGQNDAALPLLHELSEVYPDRQEYLYDYIAVLSWAERYEDALAQRPRLHLPEAPVYVLESLGRAARGVGKPAQALDYYRMAVQHAPDRTDSIIGLAKSLTELGRAKEAVDLLQPLSQRRPADSAVLEALAYAYQNDQRWFEALAAYNRLLAIQPADREARRQRILLTARLGAAPLALDMARDRPDLFSANELDALAIDAAAKYIRWNDLYHPLPAERFEDTDRAIALLDGTIR